MAKSVYGIYSTRLMAEEAVESMRAAGFRPEDISVLLPENLGTKDIGYEKHSKAPEHAALGGTAGGVVGGVLAWLLGIGVISIPGLGPLLAAGPIVSAMAGFGAGSVIGGLAGALTGAGIPEYEAKRYEGRIRSGAALVSVHCDTDAWTGRAKEMLKNTGAEDISVANAATVPARHAPVEQTRP